MRNTEIGIRKAQPQGFTRAGAQTVIDRFINMGILTPKDKGKKYGQSYTYKNYIDIFMN